MTGSQDKQSSAEEYKPATEMAKAYSSQSVEQRWYEWWEKNSYFTPDVDSKKKPYTIIMPCRYSVV